jgi:hypothetical protein
MPPAPPERFGMSDPPLFASAALAGAGRAPEDFPYQATSVATGNPLNLANSFFKSLSLSFMSSWETPNIAAMPKPQRPASSDDKSNPIFAANALP